MLVMSRSLAFGSRAGVITAAGISTGLLGHTILATLGLGALLQTSEQLFMLIKLAGATYLGYLGIKLWRTPTDELDVGSNPDVPKKRLFVEGALSNVMNPKVAIFYFAFLPQFVPTATQRPAATLFALGFVFALITFLTKGPMGLFAGRLSGWFHANPNRLKWIYRSSGTLLIGLGLKLALENLSVDKLKGSV